MPRRKHIFTTGEFYHIISRGINRQPIFSSDRDRERLIDLIQYLQHGRPKPGYSQLLKFSDETRMSWLRTIEKQQKVVEVLCYVLMPNHLHLVIRQLSDGGVQRFAHDLFDSYTRYFNTRYERTGTLFDGRFRSVHVETDEQLLHLTRYVHLNVFTARVVATLSELKRYPWSSLPSWLSEKGWKSLPTQITTHFLSPDAYWKFIIDRADYQLRLGDLKLLLLE